jgi:hypothetical protein
MRDEQKEKIRRLVPKILLENSPISSDELLTELRKNNLKLRLNNLRVRKIVQSDKMIAYDKKRKAWSAIVREEESTRTALFSSLLDDHTESGAATSAGCTSIIRQEKYSNKNNKTASQQSERQTPEAESTGNIKRIKKLK